MTRHMNFPDPVSQRLSAPLPERLPEPVFLDQADLEAQGAAFGQQVALPGFKAMRLNSALSRGRFFAREPWPGLYFGGHDVEYLQDSELEVCQSPAVFFGITLSGPSGRLRLAGGAEIPVRPREPLLLTFDRETICHGSQRAGQHSTGIGLRITPDFFTGPAPESLKAALAPFRRRLAGAARIETLPVSPRLVALAGAAMETRLEGPQLQLHLDGLLMSFLAELAALIERADHEPARAGLSQKAWARVAMVTEHLREGLDNTPSLAALARLAGTNPTTLGREFQAVHGEPVFGWFRNLRLDHARSLLRLGEESVTEICFRVGFTNPAAFATAYRRRFGHPPSQEAPAA